MVKELSRKDQIIQGYWDTMIEVQDGLNKTR